MHSHVASNAGGGVPKNAFYDRIEEDLDEDKKSQDGGREGADESQQD